MSFVAMTSPQRLIYDAVVMLGTATRQRRHMSVLTSASYGRQSIVLSAIVIWLSSYSFVLFVDASTDGLIWWGTLRGDKLAGL